MHQTDRLRIVFGVAAAACLLAHGPGAGGADSPMLGGSPSRNFVNLVEKNLPIAWNVEEGKHKNIRWWAEIGGRGHSNYCSPVIANECVYVATNNLVPRDPKVKGDRAVLMCFQEKTGKFLWQVTHDMAPPQVNQMAVADGLCSTPTVEGDSIYYVTPGCIVVRANAATGEQQWSYDLMKKLGVYPCMMNSCAPLVVGDLVYVTTGNGVDDQGEVKAPKAPSFVALDRKTGALKWQSSLPGKEILHGQWGSPAYAEVNGKGQVLFPSGDGYLYGLDAQTGDLIWKFQCSPIDPKGKAKRKDSRNYLVATPVVHDGKAYIGVGVAPEAGFSGDRVGHFWCIDITKKGDVSPKSLDPTAPENKNSALVWHYGGEVNPRPKLGGRSLVFGQTLSSPSVQDGLMYINEETGFLHCLDAKTGKKQWDYDFKSDTWSSTYWVDGKVYTASRDGTIHVLAHGRQLKVLGQIDMTEAVESTPVAANGVLYVVTKSRLYAIAAK